MSTDLEECECESPTVNTSELLKGILDDLQILVEKQFQLVRSQIELDIRRRVSGAICIGIGFAMLLIAGTVASLATAHGIHWSMDKSATPMSSPPVWVCELMVSSALFLVALIAVQTGRAKFQSGSAAFHSEKRVQS